MAGTGYSVPSSERENSVSEMMVKGQLQCIDLRHLLKMQILDLNL